MVNPFKFRAGNSDEERIYKTVCIGFGCRRDCVAYCHYLRTIKEDLFWHRL
jgi:hypothetical protein